MRVAGAAIGLAQYVAPLPYPDPFSSHAALVAHVAAANHAYGDGGLATVLAFRIRELPPILALDLQALPRTIALFALGTCIWRGGLFQRPRQHRALLRATAGVGTTLGLLAAALLGGVFPGLSLELGLWESVVEGVGGVVLALGYGAIVVLAFERARLRRVLLLLSPVGQMALTNYLAQSVVVGLVVYGYGLGRFGRMSVTGGALTAIGLFALQMVGSAWWLRRFRFGPVEWLWRSATYAAWQPLRRVG